MAPLPTLPIPDPTLEAVDREIVARASAGPRRRYLGMSSIAEPCERKLWYGLNSEQDPEPFSARTIRMFNDGHRGEDVIISLLRMVPGIQLHVRGDDGRQFRVEDYDGRFAGHLDGAIIGLIQAPKTWHVFEAKVCNEKKFAKLNELKVKLGEKQALEAWDPIYYGQAVAYMSYTGMTRHYLVAATPGTRDLTSVRTNENPVYAMRLKAKAERILNAKYPLARISNDPDWWQCKSCQWRTVCHQQPESDA